MLRRRHPDGCWSDGQIGLEEAWFCVECELMFAGISHCPCCGGGVAWPLTQWLSCTLPALPTVTGVR